MILDSQAFAAALQDDRDAKRKPKKKPDSKEKNDSKKKKKVINKVRFDDT
jgi:hypothetical protein